MLTLGLFAALFACVLYGVVHLPPFHWPLLNVLADILAPFFVGILFFYLGAPVAALFASLFLDRIAGAIAARPPVPGDADAQMVLLARFGRHA